MHQTYPSAAPKFIMNSNFLSHSVPSAQPLLDLLSCESEISQFLSLLKLRNNLQTQIIESRLNNFMHNNNQMMAIPQLLPLKNYQRTLGSNDFSMKSGFYKVKAPVQTQTGLALNSRISSLNSLSTQLESPEGDLEMPVKLVSKNPSYGSAISTTDNRSTSLEAQIRQIVIFFIREYGKQDDEKFKHERSKYASSPALLKVFDSLVVKYSSTAKTREEMVKYVLRRAFKFFKRSIKKTTRLDSKTVSTKICEKYFNTSSEEAQKDDDDEDEDLLKLLLPFRKNSKNKTMNSAFICEVFGNSEFRDDYKKYLVELDELIEKDNKEKVQRFTSFLEECVKKDCFEEVKKYKRIPWLQAWTVKTKRVAHEILTRTVAEESFKKIKVEAQ